MSDVLKRLRERSAGSTHWAGCEDSHVDCAAVLEIKRLRLELAEARADCDRLSANWNGAEHELQEVKTKLEKVIASLNQIATMEVMIDGLRMQCEAEWLRAIAREALKEAREAKS